jgi:hypothetical protein
MPLPFSATYTPSGGGSLQFGLLIDGASRETRQQINEEVIPGSSNVVVDIVGKLSTKIKGRAIFSSFAALQTFEGAVGTNGSLSYVELSGGVSFNVVLVSIERQQVTPSDIQIGNIEFWYYTP